MNRINRFKLLEIQQDPTDYEDFEDVAPYNKLEDGKWTSLWMNRHPLAYKILNRFSGNYDGKLLQSEIDDMKKRLEKLRTSLRKYMDEVWPRMYEIKNSIREQRGLCDEKCKEKLQKHLDICIGKYKCTSNFVAYDCQFKENGRCSHYYEIEHLLEDLDRYEYSEEEAKSKIADLEYQYERALAVKENRLQEYIDDLYDDW